MGLSRASMRNFMAAADATMRELFPAELVIGGKPYAASGVGGNALNEVLEGGRVEEGLRYFRLEKTLKPERPVVGCAVDWVDAEGPVKKFRLLEVPDRPHETSWVLVCGPVER